jgi:hypothetical protein
MVSMLTLAQVLKNERENDFYIVKDYVEKMRIANTETLNMQLLFLDMDDFDSILSQLPNTELFCDSRAIWFVWSESYRIAVGDVNKDRFYCILADQYKNKKSIGNMYLFDKQSQQPIDLRGKGHNFSKDNGIFFRSIEEEGWIDTVGKALCTQALVFNTYRVWLDKEGNSVDPDSEKANRILHVVYNIKTPEFRKTNKLALGEIKIEKIK